MLNAVAALKEYFESDALQTLLTGHPDRDLPIYVDRYPAGCKACCLMLTREGGLPGDEDVPSMDSPSIRIWCRHQYASDAFQLMQNVDMVLHRVSRKNLTSTVRMMACKRNAGPERVDSTNNKLVRYYTLYDMILVPIE